MTHFHDLNEARRRATLRDLLLTQLLSSVSLNAANLGTGLLLLLAAQAMQSGPVHASAISRCSSPTWAG